MVFFQNFLPESYFTKKPRLKKGKLDIDIDSRIVKSTTSTPWISGTEWKNVYRQLFNPSSSSRAWHDAYTTMVRWSRMTRVNVPTAVVATIHLLRARNIWRSFHARSHTAPIPDWLHQCFTSPREQALLYTNLAIVQFVNAFVKEEEHRHDVRGNTVSMKELSSLAGLPEGCIALRNNFVHSSAVGALADENGLRETVVDQLWLWIKTQYWDVELEALNVSERLQEALKGEVHPPPELRIDIQQLLQPSLDCDPRESLFSAIDTSLRKEAESYDGLISCRKRRVRTVVEEVVQQLLLQEHLQKELISIWDPQCVCGSRLKMKPATSILNLLCWLLTYTLGSAIRVPPPPTASLLKPVDRSRNKQHIDAIIADVLASNDVADVGYTVADHVLAVLMKRASGPNNFMAKQWLLILVGNCCPPIADVFRKVPIMGRLCPHHNMFSYSEVAGHSKKKRVDDPSSSEPPWRVFYPCQLPAPAVRWRPLIRGMLDAKDDELNSLAWRVAEGTLPDNEIQRLRGSCERQQVPFDGDAFDGLNTTSLSASDFGAPISGTKKRPAGITVDQLLKSMADGGADHLQDEEDQHDRQCGVLDEDSPCNTGRGALTYNIDTLSEQLVIGESENNTGESSDSDDKATTETSFEDEQQETFTLPKLRDEIDSNDTDFGNNDVKKLPSNATPSKLKTGGAVLRPKTSPKSIEKILKRHTPKTERKNLSVAKQISKTVKCNLNVINKVAKCEDNPAAIAPTPKGTVTAVLKTTRAPDTVSPSSVNMCGNSPNLKQGVNLVIGGAVSKTSADFSSSEQTPIKCDPSCQTPLPVTSLTQFKQSSLTSEPLAESPNHRDNLEVAAELPISLSATNPSVSEALNIHTESDLQQDLAEPT